MKNLCLPGKHRCSHEHHQGSASETLLEVELWAFHF